MSTYKIIRISELDDLGLSIEDLTNAHSRIETDYSVFTGKQEWIIAKNRAAEDKAERIIADARARKTQPAPAATGEQLATARQVDFIMDLLARRRRSGEEGGFMSGP